MESEGQSVAMAVVVFKPAATAEYCLAPAVLFSAKRAEDQPLVWEEPDIANASYRFWFERCDQVSWDSAIVLRKLLDFAVLERIRDAQGSIIEGIEDRLENVGVEAGSPLGLRLREIDLRFNKDHGPVYHIRYSSGACSGRSAAVGSQRH